MRDEVRGIPDIPDEVAERVSRGIDYLEKAGNKTWAQAITIANDRFRAFDVDAMSPHETVTGLPSCRGHARDVSLGFCPPAYEADDERAKTAGRVLTRCWLEAARVALMRVPA